MQYSKGPYFADQGDFATAGAGNINYATTLDRPIGPRRDGHLRLRPRAVRRARRRSASGHLLAAFETSTNSGPWTVPDSYRKFNGVVRYSQGDNVNGLSLTSMGYHGEWNATEASPQRAIDSGLIDRFGSIDPTDGGHTYRYSVGGEWQHGSGQTLSKIQAYGLGYDLGLISNFTFFLDDPVHGDQREQVDHRFVTGVRAFQKRQTRWGGRPVQNTFGVQFRNDDVMQVALYHTEARQRLETRNDASAIVTQPRRLRREPGGVGALAARPPWAARRRIAIRRHQQDRCAQQRHGDRRHRQPERDGDVRAVALDRVLRERRHRLPQQQRARHDAQIRRGTADPAMPVTPLVRAKGAEVGVRTVAIPHLQSTVSLWTLRLGSELVYNGDIGATEPGPASTRYGVEFANYYSPKPWLIFDGDVSWSRARFAEFNRGRSIRARGRRRRRLRRGEHRQLPSDVRQPAASLLRPARAHRGQLGAVEGDDASELRGRISVRQGASC